jgi:pimeloyl-ACP methyl ester carboxylesterase
MSLLRRATVAAGAIGGVAGAAYVAQRMAASRLRRKPDGGASRVLDEPIYVDHRLDSHDGGSIYVVENGNRDDPAILLSHGVTLSVRTWFHQLEDLPKEGFRAIAFDHRGHGQSVLGEAGHTIENLGNDVKTVVEGLDLRDVVLVGHSIGGVAVQSFVINNPELAAERVAGIVLLSSLARTPFGSQTTRFKTRLEELTGHVPDATWIWNNRNLGFLIARLGFGKTPRPSHVELVRRMMAECSHETRLNAPRALVGLDLTPDLPRIRVPTLLIGGTADPITPVAESERIARLIPDARLEVLEGGGHMLMLEDTEAVNRLIADFAREVRARRHSAA